MRNFFSALLRKIAEMLEKTDYKAGNLKISSQKAYELETSREEEQRALIEENQSVINKFAPTNVKKTRENKLQKKKTEIIPYPDIPIRDVIDLMEFPFLALSKDRVNPIAYESKDKTQRVEISGHRGHFIASIYDWDIILVVAGKIQEILNNSSDIPSKKIIIPRHELLKALHRQDGKRQHQDLEKSLDRLKLTGINTTINNKDFRYRSGFGFIDRWGYLERKNNKEIKVIHITLSDWLYELCCAQGSLLKSDRSYFELTSGLKRFLYRTARKHAGNNRDGWEFTIKKLYEKSGSEREFKKFKSDLMAAVIENNIPDYTMQFINKNNKNYILFKPKTNIDKIEQLINNVEVRVIDKKIIN
ncbi:MAG: replication initiator protein A [Candidatus Rhabdochlamydia sp.]